MYQGLLCSVPCISSIISLSPTLRGRYHYYLKFTNKETGSEKFENLANLRIGENISNHIYYMNSLQLND